MTLRNIRYQYYVWRSKYWRSKRMLFISPAEIRFVRLMGGHVLVFKHIRGLFGNRFPLAIVLSLGRILKRECIQREVRVGSKYADFAAITPYDKKAIEIDGRDFHRSIVREQERDDYFHKYGWSVMHVQAEDLWRRPDWVQREVIKYLAK